MYATKIRIMNNVTRKIVLVLLAIGATALIVKILASFVKEEEKSAIQKTYRNVRIEEVQLSTNKAEVQFSGKLSAVDKIDIYTEVGGILLNESFKEGNYFKKGEVIANLNAVEFANNLKAQKTQLITQVSSIMGDLKIDFEGESVTWESFLNKISVDKPLPGLPEMKNDKLKRFIAGKGILNSYYTLKSQEEKLSKFQIAAPFNGFLTSATIQKGTLIRGGQKIGEFINPAQYELETEVSLSDLKFIQVGTTVQLKSDELNKSWQGKVVRINNSLNQSSQMVKIFVNVRGDDLKEGMFLNAYGNGSTFDSTFVINRKLLNNDGIYLVDSNKILFEKVEVLHVTESKAIVKGLNDGDQFVADNMKGLYEGMEVTIAK